MPIIHKRTLREIDKWLSAGEVYKLITTKSWPYKQNIPFYQARDKALMSIDFTGAFRNNEPLRNLRKSNFRNENNYLFLMEGKISKRSAKLIAKYGSRVTTREEIYFPKFTYALQPFTDLVLTYLELLNEDQVLFPFGERRHHQTIYKVTGQWVHWLRAMGENWYGHNVFRNDPLSLAKFIGVVNVQSVMPYTGFDKEGYIKRLKQSTQDTH